MYITATLQTGERNIENKNNASIYISRRKYNL